MEEAREYTVVRLPIIFLSLTVSILAVAPSQAEEQEACDEDCADLTWELFKWGSTMLSCEVVPDENRISDEELIATFEGYSVGRQVEIDMNKNRQHNFKRLERFDNMAADLRLICSCNTSLNLSDVLDAVFDDNPAGEFGIRLGEPNPIIYNDCTGPNLKYRGGMSETWDWEWPPEAD